MKIIGTDNLNRETISDFIWLDAIEPGPLAERVVERLNKGLGDYEGTFYKLVPDDYKLYVAEY